jgi:chlorite dismutase
MNAMPLFNDVLPVNVLRHGAYLCLHWISDGSALSTAPVEQLAEQLGFVNEFNATTGHPSEAFAFLRRVEVTPGQIADQHLLDSHAVVHAASTTADRLERFCAEIMRLLSASTHVYVMRGVVRPTNFTGGAMHNFAYASQRQQMAGPAMPHAFILPMCKTPQWWAKNWMERHTHFLPRYDEHGCMLSEGHALAAAAGIPHLLRRTYKHATEPAPDGAYDFVNYFECAEDGVAVFRSVCAALRDVVRNPEWRFVREGPTWHGRRVQAWAELFV